MEKKNTVRTIPKSNPIEHCNNNWFDRHLNAERLLLSIVQEKFDDTKVVIRSRKLMDRQYNDQQDRQYNDQQDRQYNDLIKKDNRTNTDLQNITQKNKDTNPTKN